ncbi:hypothetical protein GCM10027176_05040 [Actinoallomurus bryophytorum]
MVREVSKSTQAADSGLEVIESGTSGQYLGVVVVDPVSAVDMKVPSFENRDRFTYRLKT